LVVGPSASTKTVRIGNTVPNSTMPRDAKNLTTGFREINDYESFSNAAAAHSDNSNNNGTTNASLVTTTAAATTSTNPNSKRISEFDAIQHLIKGNLGPGCLNIPHAFALSGWVLGLFLFTLVALQGIYSMILLVYCKQWLRQDRKRIQREMLDRLQAGIGDDNENENGAESRGDNNSTSSNGEIRTFMDVAHATHGRAGSICVQVLLFVLQAGVCCVFLSLIATNLHASVPSWESEWCVCLVTVLLLIVVLVKDLKELKWLSLGANCLMVAAILTASLSGLWVLLSSSSETDDDNDNHNDNNSDGEETVRVKRWTGNPAAIATFIASMFYSFEGIGLVMPVENSFVGYDIEDNEADGNPSGSSGHHQELPSNNNNDEEELRKVSRIRAFVNPVLVGSMSTVAGLFLLIGSTCGPAFPDIVDGSVTAYLTRKYPNSQWYQIINASVMVAVFLTFPLQLTPAMEVLAEWFGPGCDPVCCGSSNGSGLLCCAWGGGAGLRRDGPRGNGRHTVVSQTDDGNDDRDGEDLFRDEAAGVGTGRSEQQQHHDLHRNGLFVTDASASCDNNANAVPGGLRFDGHAGTLPKNSCFGNHEWIFRRYLVVFGCALVVLSVNDLGLLMSLFGALGNTGLAAMPCLIHWKLVQTGIAPMNFLLLAVDVGTMGMSLGVAITGVVFSVQEILHKHR